MEHMPGLYIVADLSALRAAADQIASTAHDDDGHQGAVSFGSPDANTAAGEFGSAVRDHNARMADAARTAAQTLHGYAVTFHEIGD